MQDANSRLAQFSFDEFFFKYRYILLAALLGLILVGSGAYLYQSGLMGENAKIEVLDETTEAQDIVSGSLVVDISGQVEKPGVYKLSKDSRIEDVLIIAGGFSASADRVWVEKSLNRAAKLVDGQKIYVPKTGEIQTGTLGVASDKNTGRSQSVSTQYSDQGSGLVNVNNASQKELEALPGIGPVYAQKLIEQRPYSNVQELLSKGVLKKSTYEKIKNLISVY